MRFGYAVDDAGIAAHLQHLREGDDQILARLDASGTVEAAVHIARLEGTAAELAVSVDRGSRKRGIGRAIFERALTWLRCRGVRRVFVVFLSENRSMRALARALGMSFEISSGEVTAELALALPTPVTVLQELAATQAALWPRATWPRTTWPASSWPRPWPSALWRGNPPALAYLKRAA